MNKLFTVLIAVLAASSAFTQSLSFQVGVSPCLHIPTAFKSNEIYKNNHFALKGNAGLRANNVMIISKYKYYSAVGNSIIENAQLDGYAKWEQQFTFFGIRGYSKDAENMVYSEIGVLLTKGSELISTKNEIETLYSYNKFNEIGLGIGFGLDIPLGSILALNAESEFGIALTDSNGGAKKHGRVNIGGLTLSLGLVYIINNNDEN